jgi:low affinity Fe/Cu permease
MREGFAALAGSPSTLLVMTLAILASYGLRLADAIDNWAFVICLVAIPLAASIVATLSAAAEQRTQAKLDGVAAETPLEWVGIDRPWNDDDVDALDRYLGTSESEWEPSGAG